MPQFPSISARPDVADFFYIKAFDLWRSLSYNKSTVAFELRAISRRLRVLAFGMETLRHIVIRDKLVDGTR